MSLSSDNGYSRGHQMTIFLSDRAKSDMVLSLLCLAKQTCLFNMMSRRGSATSTLYVNLILDLYRQTIYLHILAIGQRGLIGFSRYVLSGVFEDKPNTFINRSNHSKYIYDTNLAKPQNGKYNSQYRWFIPTIIRWSKQIIQELTTRMGWWNNLCIQFGKCYGRGCGCQRKCYICGGD